jgi:4-hydroxy-tetrahydrodipicolinate reductase
MTGTVRVALIGMGKMGHAIARLAEERGVPVVARLGRGDAIDAASLGGADVAVEFSEPAAAVENVRACVAAGCAVVVGTTGWWDALPALERAVRAAGGRMLWSANFSLGVNVMLHVAAEAGRLLRASGMGAHVVETHHAQKKDAPSGTAIALARATAAAFGSEVPIASVRVGFVPGRHEVLFDGPFEQLRIVHEARDRRVFAEGALAAARWLAARREPGVYTMSDVLASAGQAPGGAAHAEEGA